MVYLAPVLRATLFTAAETQNSHSRKRRAQVGKVQGHASLLTKLQSPEPMSSWIWGYTSAIAALREKGGSEPRAT